MRWRQWILILGVSFLLHLAVFWPSPEFKLQSDGLSAFSVRIVPTVSDPGVSDPGEKEATLPVSTPEPSHVSRPSEVKSEAQRNVGANKGLPDLRRGGMPEASPIASQPEANSTGKGDAPSPGRMDAPAISETGSLARYRIALAAAAIRLRDSVTSADDGLIGTAVVDVRFSGSTSVPQVTLSRYSGFEQLDNEAVTLLARAVHVVPVSDAGPIGDVSLRLPVVFESAGK